MTIKKFRREARTRDHDEKIHKVRDPRHLTEKHLKNALRRKSFNMTALSDAEQDELGFEDTDYIE